MSVSGAAPRYDHLAHGIDARVRAAQVFVNDHTAAPVQLQTGSPGKLAVWAHADRENHKLCAHSLSAVERDGHIPAGIGKAGNAVSQAELHTVLRNVLMQELRHLVIKRRHHLIKHFYGEYLKTGATQILRHFKTYKASAYDSGRPYALLPHKRPDIIRIRHCPERLDPF